MRILLVDDDTSVIQAFLPALKTLPGHDVRVATNGDKALENAGALGGVDLLITDVVMEPMDGFTLRDQLTALYPELRIIFITGYDLGEYSEQIGNHQLLQKPFEPAALLAAVEKELAPPESIPVAVAPVAQRAAPKAVAPPQVRAVVPRGSPRATAVTQARAANLPPSPLVRPMPSASRPIASPPTLEGDGVPPSEDSSSARDGEQIAWTTSQPVSPSVSHRENLVGCTIGSYEIVSKLGEGHWGTAYAAVQTSINRPVGLKVLDPVRAADEASRLRFIANARAKALVQHPAILAVYEAGESDGLVFYAHEYVEGRNLAELAGAGQKVEEPVALKILRSAAEGLAYLHLNNIPHTPLEASSVYFGTDGHVRLANLATQHADQQLSMPEEITALGRAVFAIIHTGPKFSQGMRELLSRMVQAATSGLNSWGHVLQAVKVLEPKIIPVEAAKIGAQDRAAIAAVEAARRAQKKAVIQYVAGSVSLLALGLWVASLVFRNKEHVIDEMVSIPAGTYTVGDRKVPLPEFWIDKHEVTIGQYARFLAYLEQNPGNSKDFDHPRQPKQLGHQPTNWAIFYGRAKAGKPVHSAPYSLDSPMVEVTWWDAYAYAKWRGHELPTEEQWEAAARGAAGHVYPWGDQFDPKKVNSGADFIAKDPSAKGKADGWNFWSPVDAVSGDKSPFGVIGMAGNVSEWVNTWTADNRFPIIKGGSFRSAEVRLTKRVADHEPGKGEEHIGFRTASNTRPANTK